MQKGRSRPYFVYWTNPFTGKRESKSCKTEQEAKKLDAYVKYQLQYERETFRRPELEDKSKTQAVQTLECVMFLYLKDRQLSKRNLVSTLSHVTEILSQYGDTLIENVDKSVLEKMQSGLVAKGYLSATIRRKMGIVKAVIHWAHRNEIITTLPLFPVGVTVKHNRYVPPTPEEISALYEVAPDHLRRIIILGYYVGMRVGQCELLRLKWADVDLQAQVIRVPNADKGNSDPWREVPITAEITAIMREWKEADSEINADTVVHYKGKAIAHFSCSWLTAKRRAGITRQLRPYDLRHGFATQLIARGADVGTVAQLMGHTSPVMVLKHYQHVLNQQKRDAIESLPPTPQCVQTNVCKQ